MNVLKLRNGKVRVVVGAAAGLLVLALLYWTHDTRTKLFDSLQQVKICEHRHESNLAQLQVIIEHRSRLEKSIQQEKLSHKQTKDKLESQYEELQEMSEKSKQETQAKYSALQQQYKTLQRQQEELHKEFSKLQQINSELQDEKMNLVNKMTSEMDQLRIAKDTKSVQLQAAITRLEREKEELTLKLDQSPIINQLQNDLAICRTQLRTTASSLLLNHSKPVAKIVKAEDEPTINENLKKVDKEINVNNIVEQINFHPVIPKLDAKLNQNVSPPQPLSNQEDNKNNRQIPPPLDNNKAEHYLQDNEVNNPDDVRQVEEPDRQNKIEIDNKDVVRQAINRQAIGVQEQIMNAKGVEVIKDPANGLDQQENDGDQDLDNLENEVEDRKAGNQFDGADFDQGDQDDTNGNRNNNDVPVKQEGVIAAPR